MIVARRQRNRDCKAFLKSEEALQKIMKRQTELVKCLDGDFTSQLKAKLQSIK